MMKDPAYCYKFYWLEAIVQLISQNKKEATYDEIINEISKLLDDLDAEIREKVEEVINQMYEDGDLTPILKSVMEENPDIIQDILMVTLIHMMIITMMITKHQHQPIHLKVVATIHLQVEAVRLPVP
mgnify:CR=1 FL=1